MNDPLNTTLVKDSIVSNEVYGILSAVLICGLNFAICLLGIMTNCVNLITFSKVGLSDNVTFCFFILSLSDLCALIIILVAILAYYFHLFTSTSVMDLIDLNYFLAQYFRLFYGMSVTTTTYIAVQRGCCVAFPFYFKGVFTRNKSLALTVVTYTLLLACFLPAFSKMVFRTTQKSNKNVTILALHFKEGWIEAKDFIQLFNKIILVFTGQILVILCLVVIVIGMKSSAQFRQASSSAAIRPTRGKISKDAEEQQYKNKRDSSLAHKGSLRGKQSKKAGEQKYKTNNEQRQEKQSESQQHQQSTKTKELRVVRQVILVSMVYVICTTPQILSSIAGQLIPEFNNGKSFTNLFWIVNICVNSFEFFNASVNFFIYFNFNSKFKDIVVMYCRRCVGCK